MGQVAGEMNHKQNELLFNSYFYYFQNADLGTVFVHVPAQLLTPAVVSPLLAVTLIVHAAEVFVALPAGLATVDPHVVGVVLALPIFGPVPAPLGIVLAARRLGWRRGRGRGCGCSAIGTGPTYLGIAATLVEGVDLPDIRVRETCGLSYLTMAGFLLHDRLQPPSLNRTRELFLRK